ncbi:MAG: hypothetical protein DRQ63_12250 [Gammaproteobacteria bacterium]|nr:MAG: hypothetical protein DRQ63_12250 [Gammaproteobacteria bacterium]
MHRYQKNSLRGLLGALLLSISALAPAAEFRDILVEREDGLYSMRSVVFFNVEPEYLYRVLTDFDLFKKFTSAIVESNNVEADENGRPQFFARMEGCVLVWCKSFVRNGYLELNPIAEIIAISDPARSDFEISRERWQLIPEGDGTVMIYEFQMVPAFWVPPIIGPFYIKRALSSGGVDAVDRIEALAIGKKNHQLALGKVSQE